MVLSFCIDSSCSSESESINPSLLQLWVLGFFLRDLFFEDNNSCSSLEKLLSERRLNPWLPVSHTVSWPLHPWHLLPLNQNPSLLQLWVLGFFLWDLFFEDNDSCGSLEKLLSERRLIPWQPVSHTVSWPLHPWHLLPLNQICCWIFSGLVGNLADFLQRSIRCWSG